MASQFERDPESAEMRVIRSLTPSIANGQAQTWMTEDGEFSITVYTLPGAAISWVLKRAGLAILNSMEPGLTPPHTAAGAIDQAIVEARKRFACWFPELGKMREEMSRWIGCGRRVRAEVTGEAALDDEIACVRRELGKRRSLYPKWVGERRMTEEAADREIRLMDAVLCRLQGLSPKYEQRAKAAAAQPNLFEEA